MKESTMKISKFFRAAIAIGALCVGFVQSAQADVQVWTGDTTGGPTIDLTIFGVPATAAPYQAHAFTVDTSGVYTFQLTTTGHDSIILLYENAFDPAAPESNFITGNDDDVYWTTSAFAGELVTGTTYYFVSTGYDNGEFGEYKVLVGGPGLITAVPEPSTWLMLGLGLVAVGYTARRKTLH
jgi:hypothetical protein